MLVSCWKSCILWHALKIKSSEADVGGQLFRKNIHQWLRILFRSSWNFLLGWKNTFYMDPNSGELDWKHSSLDSYFYMQSHRLWQAEQSYHIFLLAGGCCTPSIATAKNWQGRGATAQWVFRGSSCHQPRSIEPCILRLSLQNYRDKKIRSFFAVLSEQQLEKCWRLLLSCARGHLQFQFCCALQLRRKMSLN